MNLIAIAGIAANCSCCAEIDARAIVARSIENYEKDWHAALNFTYLEHEVSKDNSGRGKAEVSQVTVIDGTPYSRLIAKNGHPLTGGEARKEDQKYQRAIESRGSETAEQKAQRQRKYDDERRFIREIPNAFNMKLLERETIGGRANYVIQLTPRTGYVPASKNARMFHDIEGKLWIDEQDMRWTKAEAEVIDTISIGWIMARIGPGAHIALNQTKVDGEHWMPKEIRVNGEARIMLVKNKNVSETISYSDYKHTGRTQKEMHAKAVQ